MDAFRGRMASIPVALTVGVLGVLAGCVAHRGVEVPETTAAPGELISATLIRRYPRWFLALGLGRADLPAPVAIDTGVNLYRFAFWTTAADGSPVRSSGVLGVPRGDTNATPLRGVVEYFHGTILDRREVPSRPSLEGVLVGAVFAGARYLFVAPDYQGSGEFLGPHPYLYAESAARDGRAALAAAQRLLVHLGVPWPSRLFLVGASQGGHAALATHRAFDAVPPREARLTATAAVVGPYDLAGITFPTALAGGSRSHVVYLAYMVDTYARIYGQPTGTVLRAPWNTQVAELFDGRHDDDAVRRALPTAPRLLFREDFLAGYAAGQSSWLLRALEANSVNDWRPAEPVRLYYGAADSLISPREAMETAARMAAQGAPVEAVCVGDLDHEKAALAAVPLIRQWFDALAVLH